MNFEIILKNFYKILSSMNYDELFYNGKTGKSIPFKNVFPSGNYSIVGNSSISLEKKNGLLIDSADIVVRFNNFELLNFESHIGSKTDIWITGGGNQAPNNIPETKNKNNMKKILVMNNYKSFKEKQLKILEKYTSNELSSFIIFHNNIFLKSVIDILQGIPTTGFLIILLLSSKYKTINTYGFSFGKYKNKYHYYNDNVKQDYGHRWCREYEIFKILLNRKILFNNDILGNVYKKNINQQFYNKHLPKHVKKLYNQRNINLNNKFIINNNINNSFQNQLLKQKQNNNHNNTKLTIVEDTNNKLLELKNFLR